MKERVKDLGGTELEVYRKAQALDECTPSELEQEMGLIPGSLADHCRSMCERGLLRIVRVVVGSNHPLPKRRGGEYVYEPKAKRKKK